MATNAPSPELGYSEWVNTHQIANKGSAATSGLELGMSSMNLIPSTGTQGVNGLGKLSMIDDSGSHSNRDQRMVGDSGDSVNSHRSSTNSPLPNNNISASSSKGMSRPPGLGLPATSAIGKPGHSYNGSNASTAQGLTLTPTSSLDGGSDFYSMGRQSSPFHGDGPSTSSDYSRLGRDETSELPPGFGNLGSFEAEDVGHDGLLGLQALGDRNQSMGAGNHSAYSSSPPVRVQLSSHVDDSRGIGMDQRRPRTVSRDGGRPPSTSRPPLSGSVVGGDSGNFSHGVISRPDVRYSQYGEANEQGLGPSRRRSISTDTGREFNYSPYSGSVGHAERNHSMDHLSQKFSSLSSISSQPDQQRLHSQYQFQKHQRSMSQPGPMGGQGAPDHQIDEYGSGVSSQRYSPSLEHEYSMQHQDARYGSHQYQPRRPSGDGGHIMQNRSMSMTHGTIQNSFDGSHLHAQRRGSLQAFPSEFEGAPIHVQRRASLQAPMTGSGMYGQSRQLQRRESLDFVPGHNRYSDSSPIVATNDELRMFSGSDSDRVGGYLRHERMVTPAHSPLHTTYGTHSRHSSDMGSSTVSSSPMSLGSGVRGIHGQSHDMYNQGRRGSHHKMSNAEEEFSHGLLGEHIDVPADDGQYLMNEGIQSHSQMRVGIGHPGTMEHPTHYAMESSHHLPTAGAALPIPKAVYNVKFKRTQRSFALGPRLNRDLKVGTYVKVEADRGEDLGIVVGKLPPEKYNVPGRPPYRSDVGIMPPPGGAGAPGGADLKRIIRLATHDEVSLLGMKREEEEELLKVCRTKCRQRGLPMHVVDAEYQFDRHKLTFFFEAEGRIDFRELVRDLFSIYKTRIWMQQLDKNTAATCPTGASTPQPLVMDYGTPIIAPESEFSEFAALNADNEDAEAETD